MSGKDFGKVVSHLDTDWYVEGAYWPDEQEWIEIENVFLVHSGDEIQVPYEALSEDFLEDIAEKILSDIKNTRARMEHIYGERLLTCLGI